MNSTQLDYQKSDLLNQTFTSFDKISNNIEKKRSSQSCGKIIKNFERNNIRSSEKCTKIVDKYMANYQLFTENCSNFKKEKSHHKFSLRIDDSFSEYNQKLAIYEKNKKDILRDVGQKNNNAKEISKSQNSSLQKQHFLTSTLKHSLQLLKMMQQTSKQNLINSDSIQCINSQKRQLKKAIEDEKYSFIQLFDHQIRLETKLRKIKMQITPYNKKEIKQNIDKIFNGHQYDFEQFVKIDYQEFDPLLTISIDNKISPQVIAEKLVSLTKVCEANWKQKLYKKFNTSFIRVLYLEITKECKTQVDVKKLTKGFNIYFKRNYTTKDLFKLFSRIGLPVTKTNFIYHFSK